MHKAKCLIGLKFDSEVIQMGKRINYDDDLVVVTINGKEIYRGIEDNEPLKYELWKWNESEKAYFLKRKGNFIREVTYKKECIE